MHQEFCRCLYHIWRARFMQSRENFFCVIHDKMNHYKIALLQLQVKNKMVSRLKQLLVTLIGMITHGYGDEAFVQYSNELMTLISRLGHFCTCFVTLKRNQSGSHGFCLSLNPKTHFFQQILQGNSYCLNALKHEDKIVGEKPLPRKLLLHMDNCVKDNKNSHLLTFLSLNVREVFEEVQLRFLVLGTHMKILTKVLDICQRN